MKCYQHTQTAWIGISCAGLLFLICAGISLIKPMALFPMAIIGITIFVFRSLTVEISDAELVWYFGPGWPRGRKPLTEIAYVEPMRIHWWNGWGIHNTSRGWLYNVSGFGAVCVTQRNGKRFCLGTDESETLTKQLTMLLNQYTGTKN